MLRYYLLFAVMMCCMPMKLDAQHNSYVELYAGLLHDHVSVGKLENIPVAIVDYGSWSVDKRHSQAIEQLARVNPDSLFDNALMAFWINAYNLLTIDLIITQQEKHSIRKIGHIFTNPWKDYQWTIHGKRYTLDQIEHDILRPMGDPRIHMAVNCASISCPDLRREPYIPDILTQQLDQQVRLFVNQDEKGVFRDIEGNISVSKIFDWFEEDWKNPNIIAFIHHYRADIRRDEHINDYLSYNWNLNGIW